MKRFTAGMICALILCLGLVAFVAHGGDLAPPPEAFDTGNNPVATMKTLNEVEPRYAITAIPYMITNSGSYYLIRSITTTSNITGIKIMCSDVMLDLNGFALTGTTNSQDAIEVVGTNQNITIRNGSLRQWGKFGINAPGAIDGSVEGIKANKNGLGGIYYGNGALIYQCSAFGNGYKAPLPPRYNEPTIVDTDFDGLDDDFEQQIIDADPNDSIIDIYTCFHYDDFDGDGTSNMDEFYAGTDPTVSELPDSDWDGMDDQWEQQIINASAVDSISNIWTCDPYDDFDTDGAMNQNEFWSGTDPTDPSSVDMDQDGMNDPFEMMIVNDNTNDTIWSVWEVQGHHDYDGDGASNRDEYEAEPPTDPTNPGDVPANAGTQSEYASYTNPPTGPMFDNFEDPTDEESDDGIRAGAYSTVRECKARGNRGSGIYVLFGSRVLECTGAGNLVDGIHVTDYCSVISCLAARNLKDGITCGAKCRIKDNNCGQNGDYTMANQAMPEGAGIRIMGNGNRVEGNNVTGNAIGIKVDDAYSFEYGNTGMSGGRNLIILNSAVDNWGMAFDLSGGDYMGGTMYQGDTYNAASTNTAAMMDSNNPFSNFNF